MKPCHQALPRQVACWMRKVCSSHVVLLVWASLNACLCFCSVRLGADCPACFLGRPNASWCRDFTKGCQGWRQRANWSIWRGSFQVNDILVSGGRDCWHDAKRCAFSSCNSQKRMYDRVVFHALSEGAACAYLQLCAHFVSAVGGGGTSSQQQSTLGTLRARSLSFAGVVRLTSRFSVVSARR
jgi:hypothetical protein